MKKNKKSSQNLRMSKKNDKEKPRRSGVAE